ncbi:MAG: FAD-dependent oxidoreductase [Candidatus Eisenbacteria bacterium]|nr:FAD-dependent oxidoreductase [Candidatus Eisenbacteria bacterium]
MADRTEIGKSSAEPALDVAVIGGGIAGLSCARELARGGLRVAIFDLPLSGAASAAAAGMLAPWAEPSTDPDSLALREAALALYPTWIESLEKESGLPIDMMRCGSIVVSLDGEEAASESFLWAQDRIPGYRRLAPEEARAEVPILTTDVADAVLLPEEGYAEPRSLLAALRATCRRLGVETREEVVLGLEESEGRVRGVRTATGTVPAAAVLNATGAWASVLLPEDRIRPIRGQLLVLKPDRSGIRLNRIVHAAGGGTYLVPRQDGSLVVGSTSEDVGFQAIATANGALSLLERAIRLAPSLQELSLIHI